MDIKMKKKVKTKPMMARVDEKLYAKTDKKRKQLGVTWRSLMEWAMTEFTRANPNG